MPEPTEWLEQFIKNTEDLEGDYQRARDTWQDLQEAADKQGKIMRYLLDDFVEKATIYKHIQGHDWEERSWAHEGD